MLENGFKTDDEEKKFKVLTALHQTFQELDIAFFRILGTGFIFLLQIS